MWVLALLLHGQVLAPDTDHLCDVAARFIRQPRTMVERTATSLGIQRTWTDDEVAAISGTFGLRLLEFPELRTLTSGTAGSLALNRYNQQFRERVQFVANGGPVAPAESTARMQQTWATCELAGY